MQESLSSNFFQETKQALIYTFSDRIGLRNWSPADCWPEQIAMNDPECRHMFSAEGPPSNIDEYLEDQKTLLRLEEDNIGLSVAITEKLTGKWLGYCLFRLDPTVQKKLVLERTLFLIPQVWGTGITQELDSLTKSVLFNKGVSAISHYVKLENERAMKSLLKQGRIKHTVVPYHRNTNIRVMHFTLEKPQMPSFTSKEVMIKNFSTELQEAIAHYWDVAYKEGQENRNHDTVDNDAQKALTNLNQKIKEQAQREALNALKVSSSEIWENGEIMSLNAKLGLSMEDLQKLFSHYNKIVLSKI